MRSVPVFVAVGKIRLAIPGCRSLKEKRSVLKPLLLRLRDKFGVCAAEVGHHDAWESAVVGVATIGNEAPELDAFLSRVLEDVGRGRRAAVVDLRKEIISAGGIGEEPAPVAAEGEGLEAVETEWIEKDK